MTVLAPGEIKTLGVKLCGNCNPDIHSLKTAQRVAELLHTRLTVYEEGEWKLTVSACVSACVENEYPAPAMIRGLSVNGVECGGEAELAQKAAAVLIAHYRGKTDNN